MAQRLAAAVVAVSSVAAAAPPGDVTLAIVAPDGRPAAGAVVHLAELDQHHFGDDPAPRPATVTADANGVAHVR